MCVSLYFLYSNRLSVHRTLLNVMKRVCSGSANFACRSWTDEKVDSIHTSYKKNVSISQARLCLCLLSVSFLRVNVLHRGWFYVLHELPLQTSRIYIYLWRCTVASLYIDNCVSEGASVRPVTHYEKGNSETIRIKNKAGYTA